jgi:multidrug efflux system membrane fusion protein
LKALSPLQLWRRRSSFLIGICVAVVMGAWFVPRLFASTEKKPATPLAVSVVLAKVTAEDVADSIAGIGTVQASASVTIRARVDGELQRVLFSEGQDVHAGDILAQIDPRPFQAQVDQAAAQLARDEAQVANAQLDLKRNAALLALDSIAQQTYDTQKAQLAQYEATVRADRAQFDYARVQLGYTSVSSPIDGRTGMRLTDAGNLVRAAEATGIAMVNQIDPVTLTFTIAEDNFARVSGALKHGKAPLQVLAYGRDETDLLGQGKLLLINNQIDAGTGTVQLKAQFANPEHKLWPGQFINVRLVLGNLANALVVPASAVQRGPDGTFVYSVRADQTVEVSNVKVALLRDGKAVIAEGLKAGDVVVADGQAKLRPGSHINGGGGSKETRREPTAGNGGSPG